MVYACDERASSRFAHHRWVACRLQDQLKWMDEMKRLVAGRTAEPSATLCDSCTVPSPPASGMRAGYDGARRRQGSKVHMAVDILRYLLAAHGTAASE
jgi:hypothetical protein